MDMLIAIIKEILLSDANIEAKRYRIESFLIKVATWASDKLKVCPDPHLNVGPFKMHSGKEVPINYSVGEKRKEDNGRAKYIVDETSDFVLENHRRPNNQEKNWIIASWENLSNEEKAEYMEDDTVNE